MNWPLTDLIDSLTRNLKIKLEEKHSAKMTTPEQRRDFMGDLSDFCHTKLRERKEFADISASVARLGIGIEITVKYTVAITEEVIERKLTIGV